MINNKTQRIVINILASTFVFSACKPGQQSGLQDTGDTVTLNYKNGVVTGTPSIGPDMGPITEIKNLSYAVTMSPRATVSRSFVEVASVSITAAKFKMGPRSCDAAGSSGLLTVSACIDMMTTTPQVVAPVSNQGSDETIPSGTYSISPQYGNTQVIQGITYQDFSLSLSTPADNATKRKVITSVTYKTHPTFAQTGQETITTTAATGFRTPRLGTYASGWTTGVATVNFADGSSTIVPGTVITWKKPATGLAIPSSQSGVATQSSPAPVKDTAAGSQVKVGGN